MDGTPPWTDNGLQRTFQKSMKPYAINHAIAKYLGWHHFILNDEYGNDRALKPDQEATEGCIFTDLPDYYNDLVAMYQAEEYMLQHAPEHLPEYRKHLYLGTGGNEWHASAKERAIAFVKATHGKQICFHKNAEPILNLGGYQCNDCGCVI
jgi:hypothetical protein